MKISKLFHWLYAFLMFMPILALIPSVAYFAFNQKSENYTYQTVTETYEYETNEVNSVNDLVEGNIYKFNITDTALAPKGINYFTTKNFYNSNIYDSNLSIYHSENEFYFRLTEDNTFVLDTRYLSPTIRIAVIKLSETSLFGYFVYIDYINNSAWEYLNISASDYLGEKSVTITESEQSPMNIFYTSVDKTFESPIFSWAKTSFLVAPFAYIGGLFGVPSVSPLTYYLSYWLAISIIYLVFDLVMYVPLLVHRWIDKGMIE